MLKGEGQILLSKETMECIVQEYFDRNFAAGKAPVVIDIKMNYSDQANPKFDVHCREAPTENALLSPDQRGEK
jgi:hypothetical protein